MALKATIFKASLQIADMDRHHYQDHSVTLARHPSESDERMMVRLLAFAVNADEALSFGAGLCDDEEPDIWLNDLTGATRLWIELGQPDEKRLKKACSRAERVIVYSYSGNSANIWWEQLRGSLSRLNNLTVYKLPAETAAELAKLAQRTMQLQCTIQEEQVLLTDGSETVNVDLAAARCWPA
ncbi:YaeQ family protein [Chitinivorax sp. PXF-14]|uniref:YaeQ family protein n=1 Tax=Chitinivorax sp. PXF-14 TaxID=3230488 RepID=UPI003466E95E